MQVCDSDIIVKTVLNLRQITVLFPVLRIKSKREASD